VRGAGLLVAAVLDGPTAADVVQRALGAGLMVNAVAPDAVRLAPPLLVADDEVDEALAILAAAIGGAGETA
jgi:acetylornithine/N-succinyldiaminopimelate aminotransferase